MVNGGLEIIFNDIFESHFSRRKREKSATFWHKKRKATAVYRAQINQGGNRRSAYAIFTSHTPSFAVLSQRCEPDKVSGVRCWRAKI
jgi:hypothetical protein